MPAFFRWLCRSCHASQNERKKISRIYIYIYTRIFYQYLIQIQSDRLLFLWGQSWFSMPMAIQSQAPPSRSIGPREEQLVCSLRHDCPTDASPDTTSTQGKNTHLQTPNIMHCWSKKKLYMIVYVYILISCIINMYISMHIP